ncbi:RNA-dependent RNA polymerase [Mammarenavirus okahandjaense]|uniref:RNA-directed RNA polymerase L n=3 Tax=Mammarenavirus okahandjaense TaxID=3052321 RepID=A0A0H3W0Y0_9VIRU|nr:RNA-dependent RNA polymerase [Mammarenavirus okahandjaense]AKH39840.1 RNA-dependent RNA polymerase [Mammarenavirus okahandjaense]
MEEYVSEIRSLVSRYISSDPRLSRQKISLLSQNEPRFILMEGLKLLSTCIEIDSSDMNGCTHNSDNLSVEAILFTNRILCPGIPLVVPDGYKLMGKTLILLECFVRSSSENFEKKYSEDITKLQSLKDDLNSAGVNVVPLVDGRMSYHNSLMPDWVCDRLRHLFCSLLEYSQESNALFEESEYLRLIDSLSGNSNRVSGLESLNTLKDCRSAHHLDIMTLCHEGINNMMSEIEIKSAMEFEYNVFRNKLLNGEIPKVVVKTDKDQLLKDFSNLYVDAGITQQDDVDSLILEGVKNSPILRFVYNDLIFDEKDQKDNHVKWLAPNVIRLLNKVKSLKIFNTRRKFLLILDSLILIAHIYDQATYGSISEELWLGSSFLSVNDRMVDLNSTKEELMRWLFRRANNQFKRTSSNGDPTQKFSDILLELLDKTMNKIIKSLSAVGLSLSFYSVHDGYYKFITLEQIESFLHSGIKPLMHYEKLNDSDYKYGSTQFDVGQLLMTFLCYPPYQLALINSMKTSSTTKIRQNKRGANRYKIVTCKESYYQEIKTIKGSYVLIYQKTGEGSKCYSINHKDYGHITSFYADPKRYFVPVFSSGIFNHLVKTMISWLVESSETVHQINDVEKLLKFCILMILSHPSKRSQKLLQNVRYFIMAYSSEFHLVGLLEKLKEDLITPIEFILYRTIRKILNILLGNLKVPVFSNIFKFILNLSYLCHFITKETPDRLTDQIKCFEKFIKPKLDFGSINVNPFDIPSQDELIETLVSADKFFCKPTCHDESFSYGTPGVSKQIFSCMVSAFNAGLLYKNTETVSKFKDPITVSGCATALDLASNKSVVTNRFKEGERILNYNFNKIVSNAVCEITDTFSRKGRYHLLKGDYDYKVQKIISKLVLREGSKCPKGKGCDPSEKDAEWSDIMDVFDGQQSMIFERIKQSVDDIISLYCDESTQESNKPFSITDLLIMGVDKLQFQLLVSELSRHPIEDFDIGLFDEEFYEDICSQCYENEELRHKYFTDTSETSVTISLMSKALTKKFFDECKYFQCFKTILLQMHGDKMTGRHSHYNKARLGLKFNYQSFQNDIRVSERESNSEAISKALSLVNFSSSALKNLCFYSEESPQSFTSISPDTGRLKFALSYKEQVGGNRELYIGDLRTKMFTRLIEDYFEAFANQFKGSCLNNELEFKNAIISMKLNVSLANLSYSMDHSKWGPMMCPLLFLACLRNIKVDPLSDTVDSPSKDHISTLLCWHIHKMVEVPFNVVNAMMKSYIKRSLGLMKESHMTDVESFFFSLFDENVVPSHISSILDMGQGILHNTSDFYGLLSERFINYYLSYIFPDEIESYTSSDDQITLFGSKISNYDESGSEDIILTLLNFHFYLSDQLNKFVSPKSVIGRFVVEFKSRFFVWGEEVPLLTKFVAAALHNVKCKEPHQLAETIDTIVDQCVANGVPIAVCNSLQERVIRLLEYAQYPIDPFLLNINSDAKDWIDGNRGYRIMRNIEALDSKGTKIIRSVMRKLYNQLKTGKLYEEFTASFLTGDSYECLMKICKLFDVEFKTEDLYAMSWLNLSSFHPIRMVLRQKVIYPNVLNVDEERIPTLIKTLQSKLSMHFTRGAQKLLSESINRSAFQSSIASGFVGLCKTLGSKCVRDEEKRTFYVKSVIENLDCVEGLGHTIKNRCHLWLCDRDPRSLSSEWYVGLLRPILWDYFCIGLSTALEIGPWVLGEPKIKTATKGLKFRSCDYYPTKPTGTRLLEDKVGYSHIIYSIRRLYPDLFEKHILPFMSDLASLKMKWSPRIKFLDLCVVLDVNCEALSLISHVIKWKREEHYVVLSSDLHNMHERQHTTLVDQRVVSTEEICKNYLKQLYFESYIRSFVLTTRVLGSFSWFPHRSALPESEGLGNLGPFAPFVEKVIYKGIERPMFRYDLYMGFSHLDFRVENPVINLSSLIASGMTESGRYDSFTEFWQELQAPKEGSMESLMNVRFTIKSQGESVDQKFKIALKFNGFVSSGFEYYPEQIAVYYSWECESKYILECWNLLLTNDSFRTGGTVWYFSTENISDYLTCEVDKNPLLPVKVIIPAGLMELSPDDFERVGPEWDFCPLIMKEGALWEEDRMITRVNVDLNDSDSLIFLKELMEDYFDLTKLSPGKMLRDRVKSGLHLKNVDLVSIIKENFSQGSMELLNEIFSHVDEWCEFRSYKLCYSKSLKKVMIACSNGGKRLKGIPCRELDEDPVVEDIE